MRVIIPILIAAVWTSATVKINGVWPPSKIADSVASISEQVEAPARSVLALLQDEPAESLRSVRPVGHAPALDPRRIALPGLPKPSRHPVAADALDARDLLDPPAGSEVIRRERC